MNLSILLKLGNLVCAYAALAKFIYIILDICSKQKKTKKKHTCLGKSEYHNRFSRLPYNVHLLFLV